MTTTAEAWTVSQLARTLKRRVEDEFPQVWVTGELMGVKRYPSGHWYFSLCDETAKVDCTMWRSHAARLSAPLVDGTKVFAFGAPSVWEERTALRFNVVQLLPTSAVGAQAQAVERTKQLLLADGLLDPGRKRAIPEFPSRIVVITSAAGAAVHDIITVAGRRWPAVEILVINTAVQGERAPIELVRALRMVARLSAIDCCIIGRGGGGREDLAAFNDESVCRAIAACPVPVVSAVGHEVDVTLSDLVADLRAATPSQAAEFVLPDRNEVRQHVSRAAAGLFGTMTSLLTLRRERLDRTRDRMGSALLETLRSAERRALLVRARLAPALTRVVQTQRDRLMRSAARMHPALERRMSAVRSDAARLAGQLHALSPLAVLARGYSVARNSAGYVLYQQEAFKPGEIFTLTVTDGSVPARVEKP